MTKVYELPNGHRIVTDVDESTRVCHITETTLDSLVSKLNYYAEQAEVLDKIRAEIDIARFIYKDTRIAKNALDGGIKLAMQIIDKYRTGSNETQTNEIVYDVGGHMYGAMGGDVIMDILAGKGKE